MAEAGSSAFAGCPPLIVLGLIGGGSLGSAGANLVPGELNMVSLAIAQHTRSTIAAFPAYQTSPTEQTRAPHVRKC